MTATSGTCTAPGAGAGLVVGRIVAAHEVAAAYYAGQLAAAAGAQAREYLHDRRFPAQAVAVAGLGYAPPGWTGLVDHLRARGYTDAELLLQAGLASPTRRESVVDRFRDRITVPVLDHAGRTVAFIARAVPGTAGGTPMPKYLNTPTTPAYSKGQVLHGLAEERGHLAAGAAVVLVEGPLDRLAVALAAPDGAYAPVAPGGTAFTPEQIAALDEAAPLAGRRVLVACDDDTAGRAAARRLFPMLAAAGAWPEHVPLPPGRDPADLWAADPTARAGRRSALRRALDDAVTHPLLTTVVAAAVAATRDDPCPERRVGAVRAATALIAPAPPPRRAQHLQTLVDAVQTTSGVAFDPETRAELGYSLDHASAAAGRDRASAVGAGCHPGDAAPPAPRHDVEAPTTDQEQTG